MGGQEAGSASATGRGTDLMGQASSRYLVWAPNHRTGFSHAMVAAAPTLLPAVPLHMLLLVLRRPLLQVPWSTSNGSPSKGQGRRALGAKGSLPNQQCAAWGKFLKDIWASRARLQNRKRSVRVHLEARSAHACRTS